MHVLKKTLISIISCFLLILSVGAEEPVTEEAEAPLVYNTEEGEDNVADTETDTTVVADDENAEDVVDNNADTDNVEASTPENNISSEPAEEVSNPVEDIPTIELGEFKNEVTYNEEHTVATIVVEYLGECTELNLANEEIIQQMVNTGVYQVNSEKGDWTNKIAFDVYANGLISLDINIWGDSLDEPLGTKRVETAITDLKSKVEIKEVEVPVTYDITSNVEGSSSQASMNVTYTNVNSYNWTIPTDFNLNDGSKLTVSVTDPQISDEAALKIKVNSANNYRLVGANPENSNAMSYTITNENGVALNNESNNVALQYNMDTDIGTKSANLTFNYNSNDALYTDTYSDQLNFTAQIGLGLGTKINIGTKKYILLDQIVDNQYLVIERDSVDSIKWNQYQEDGNVYENSYIDTYLNSTYYDSLPTEIKNAIVETAIQQSFYLRPGTNPRWEWGTKTDETGEYNGYWYNEGTVENPKWVRYYNHEFIEGELGAHPLKYWDRQATKSNGVIPNVITRKIFLPSIEDISKIVDLNSALDTYDFLKNTSGTHYHIWLRDSRYDWSTFAICLNHISKSLDYDSFYVNSALGVRPSYVLDLSKVFYTIEGKINFTINGITCKAKEGSTWEEWVNSKYNTLGYTIDSNGNISKNNMYVTNTNDINNKVSKSDVITADTAYYGSEFILTSGTKLTIGSKKYTVIEQNGADQYLLMERDSIGNIQWNQNKNDGYIYENSHIDTYLNNNYYNSLPTEIHNAIVNTTVKQSFYSLSGSGNNWYYGSKSDAEGSWYGWWYNEGTAESPGWVRWYNHTPVAGNEGAYPLKAWFKQDNGYNGVTSSEISRKIFLPSVNELLKIVDLSDEYDINNFLKDTNENQTNLWLRDSRSDYEASSLILGIDAKSLDFYLITHSDVGVRPAYTLDLSGLDYIIE